MKIIERNQNNLVESSTGKKVEISTKTSGDFVLKTISHFSAPSDKLKEQTGEKLNFNGWIHTLVGDNVFLNSKDVPSIPEGIYILPSKFNFSSVCPLSLSFSPSYRQSVPESQTERILLFAFGCVTSLMMTPHVRLLVGLVGLS